MTGNASGAMETFGPPPPFDPRLAAALEEMGPSRRRTDPIDDLIALREESGAVGVLTDERLSCDGYFSVTERSTPGSRDSPDLSLLICRPRMPANSTPAFYCVHGGGMVARNFRAGAVQPALEWAQSYAAVVVPVKYRLAPETRHPGGPVEGLSCRAAVDGRPHRDKLGIVGDRSSSSVPAPEEDWPPQPCCGHATWAAQRWPVSC